MTAPILLITGRRGAGCTTALIESLIGEIDDYRDVLLAGPYLRWVADVERTLRGDGLTGLEVTTVDHLLRYMEGRRFAALGIDDSDSVSSRDLEPVIDRAMNAGTKVILVGHRFGPLRKFAVDPYELGREK